MFCRLAGPVSSYSCSRLILSCFIFSSPTSSISSFLFSTVFSRTFNDIPFPFITCPIQFLLPIQNYILFFFCTSLITIYSLCYFFSCPYFKMCILPLSVSHFVLRSNIRWNMNMRWNNMRWNNMRRNEYEVK